MLIEFLLVGFDSPSCQREVVGGDESGVRWD
jgi:hypothetical protein